MGGASVQKTDGSLSASLDLLKIGEAARLLIEQMEEAAPEGEAHAEIGRSTPSTALTCVSATAAPKR
ncbi:MAG: hypothetical protein FWC28_04150 [Proteobacteria bacterium]|nr:hypothetical protein [Cystobacterineae bacterium]MCL2314430.1 hypothetical protein [Pseudomonadota bacterium]